jgi:hypothetical protein
MQKSNCTLLGEFKTFEGDVKMKNKFYPAFYAVLFILFISSFCMAEEKSGPSIFFAEKTFDAKEIKSGEYLEHTFKVQNKGNSPLEISDVKPG